MDSMVWIAALFFGGLLLLLFMGLPIYLVLATTAMLAYLIFAKEAVITAFPLLCYSGIKSYTLLALAFFILMGELMVEGKVADVLYDAITPVVVRIRGGLIYVNILANTLFGAISGSTIAATSATSAVAIPQLQKRGYAKGISYGSLASAGCLASLIPPSLGLILYAAITNTSVGELFIGGIVPGLILTSTLAMVTFVWIRISPQIVPEVEKSQVPLGGALLHAIKALWPIAILVFIVLGSIYFGWATPTEAGTYGVFGALIVGAKRLTLSRIRTGFVNSVRVAASLIIIIGIAEVYGYALNLLGLKNAIVGLLAGLPGIPPVKMFFIWLMLLVLGMFLDSGSAIVITTPVLLPFAVSLGYDPIWYGVWLILAVELGNITPPVGLTMFAVQSVSGDRVDIIAKGSLPYWISYLFAQLPVTFFPGIVVWLFKMGVR